MKPDWKRFLLILLSVVVILSLLLSACVPIDKDNKGNGRDKDKGGGNDKDKDKAADKNKDKGKDDKITICHKTGNEANPYVELKLSENAVKEGHATHEGDIIPAPEDGCPAK